MNTGKNLYVCTHRDEIPFPLVIWILLMICVLRNLIFYQINCYKMCTLLLHFYVDDTIRYDLWIIYGTVNYFSLFLSLWQQLIVWKFIVCWYCWQCLLALLGWFLEWLSQQTLMSVDHHRKCTEGNRRENGEKRVRELEKKSKYGNTS